MIKVKLDIILDDMERNVNWLSKKTGIANSTLYKLNNNETKSISFDTIEKICKTLNIKVQDLIEIT